jgi:hypothetical protein
MSGLWLALKLSIGGIPHAADTAMVEAAWPGPPLGAPKPQRKLYVVDGSPGERRGEKQIAAQRQ